MMARVGLLGRAFPDGLPLDEPPDTPLAALELNSIAQGVWVLDAMLKAAPVRPLAATPVSTGKYFILLGGEVDELARALGCGLGEAADTLIDEVLLPAPAAGLVAALAGSRAGTHTGAGTQARLVGDDLPALGLIETYAAPALLGAADSAAKTGEIAIEDLHLLAGIGGKSTCLLSGDVESVRVAVAAGAAHAAQRGLLARQIVIARPDPQLVPHLLRRGDGHP